MHLDSHLERRNSTFLLSAFTKTKNLIDPNGCRKAFRRGEIVIFDAMFACGRLPAQASSQQQRQPAVSSSPQPMTAPSQQPAAATASGQQSTYSNNSQQQPAVSNQLTVATASSQQQRQPAVSIQLIVETATASSSDSQRSAINL